MSKIDKSKYAGLTAEKKEILKKYKGVYSSPVDLNKLRDKEKNGKN